MARIALFLPRFSRYGGVEGFGCNLAAALAQAGHAVTFICARQETEAPPGVHVVTVGRFGLLRSGKMLWFAWAAERLRRRGAHDICIGLGKTLRQDLLRIGGGPLRTFWQLSSQAYADNGPRKLKSLRRRLSPANRLTLALEPVQLRNAATVVMVSHTVARWTLERYPWLDPAKVHVIYNEPDSTRFHPQPRDKALPLRRHLGLKGGDPLLGIAGSNFRLKGLVPLMESLRHLPEHMHLVVAGGRRPEAWQRLAGAFGVGRRVHFLGKVDDMPGFYAACDVFALPSFYDACANAVLEAVSCGVPTVSSAHNGSSVVLPPELVLQDPTNSRALAAAVLQALEGPRPEGLAWPEGALRGMPPYLELIHSMLP